MDSYTSGPWRVSTDYHEQYITVINHQDVPVAHGMSNDATAALIAAAPDLLAALRELTIACEGDGGRCMDHLLANSRSAIARATGEQLSNL